MSKPNEDIGKIITCSLIGAVVAGVIFAYINMFTLGINTQAARLSIVVIGFLSAFGARLGMEDISGSAVMKLAAGIALVAIIISKLYFSKLTVSYLDGLDNSEEARIERIEKRKNTQAGQFSLLLDDMQHNTGPNYHLDDDEDEDDYEDEDSYSMKEEYEKSREKQLEDQPLFVNPFMPDGSVVQASFGEIFKSTWGTMDILIAFVSMFLAAWMARSK